MKQRLFSITVFQLASFAFIAALFWVLRQECLQADAANQICLSSATPIITSIRSVFAEAFFPWSIDNYFLYTFYGGLAVLGILFACLISKGNCPSWGALYFIALGLCTYGELMSVRNKPLDFSALYCMGLVVALGAFYLVTRNKAELLSAAWIDPEARRIPPRWYEVGAYAVMFVAIAATRFYAVNHIPGHWDSEMCGHRPVIASWHLMIDQELGRFSQQSAGLSWVVAHRLFTRFDDPLLFFLDQRFLGAGISLANCWIVYFLMRSLAGPFAALMGLTLFAFGPIEVGWARGPSLHNLPILIGLLLLWSTFKALQERTWTAFTAVAIVIISSKYFYPSARLIALGPCLAFAGALLWNFKEWRGHIPKLLLIPLGGLGYLFSRSILWWYITGNYQWIFPFEKIQPINGEGSLLSSLMSMAQAVPVLIREIFSIPRILDHYTHHATIAPLHTLPSLAIIFVGIALARLLCSFRSPLALTWIGVLIGGIVPALMTGLADRRFGFTIIALSLLAAVELSWFANRMLAPRLPRVMPLVKAGIFSVSASCLFLSQTYGMFSQKAIRPHQLNFTEAVRPFVRPGTLVVHLDSDNPCPFFYGIYDLLRQSDGDIGYVYSLDVRGGAAEAISNPQISTETWQYRFTSLATQASKVKAKRDWSRVVYAFYVHPSTLPFQQMLKERYPNGSGREIPVPKSSIDVSAVYVFEASLSPETPSSP